MPMSELAVARAVDEALRAAAKDNENRRWELVSQLHIHGGRQALVIASRLRDHPEPFHRALAADVLSQLGAGPGGRRSTGRSATTRWHC